MRKLISKLFGGLFLSNMATPGGVVVGPQYKSNTIVFMSSDQIVEKHIQSVPKLGKAIEKLEELKVDEARDLVLEVYFDLLSNLPPDTELLCQTTPPKTTSTT